MYLDAKPAMNVIDLLSVLKNVRSISWDTNGNDLSWAFKIVCGHIITRRIPAFHMDFAREAPLQIQAFSTMSKVLLHLPSRFTSAHHLNHSTRLILLAAKIIRNSPDLESLEIITRFQAATHIAPTIYASCAVLFLSNSSPSICGPPPPRRQTSCLTSALSLTLFSIHHNLNTSILDIWNTLTKEKIYLSRVEVDFNDIERELPDYLVSYSGTRELVLNNRERRWASRLILDSTLHLHLKNLPRLSSSLLLTFKRNEWCLGELPAAGISYYRWIRELSLPVIAETKLIQSTTSSFPILRNY